MRQHFVYCQIGFSIIKCNSLLNSLNNQMKIYTKTGDKGNTSLYGGTKVPKNHLRIESYGTVDELNSFIGLLLSQINSIDVVNQLNIIQNSLFTLGAELATPNDKLWLENGKPRLQQIIQNKNVIELEHWIDTMETQLESLQNFILPAGNQAIASAHICRTVCRRAERIVVALNEFETTREICVQYLNRLSDYFFVLARYIAKTENINEIKWNS